MQRHCSDLSVDSPTNVKFYRALFFSSDIDQQEIIKTEGGAKVHSDHYASLEVRGTVKRNPKVLLARLGV